MSEMPYFFTSELGFSDSVAGVMCVVPYVGMLFVTLGFGEMFKVLQLRHGWTVRSVRQVGVRVYVCVIFVFVYFMHVVCGSVGSPMSLIAHPACIIHASFTDTFSASRWPNL